MADEAALPWAEEAEAGPQTPMQWAKWYVAKTREKKALERQLAEVMKDIKKGADKVLELIEAEELPPSFKADGASVYTREEVWASAKDGDHETLTKVLNEVGLVEYLPSKVNSQSISAYVREHYNKETGEFDGDIDPRLLEALNVTITTKTVING